MPKKPSRFINLGDWWNMKVNLKDITKYELIGLKAEIADAKNKANIGIKGKIIDETRNTIMIETKKGVKRLIKENITIDVFFRGKQIRIKGGLLVGRPEDRIKK